MRKPMTDALVRSVTPPPIGRIEINDLRSIGLTLRVASWWQPDMVLSFSRSKKWQVRSIDYRRLSRSKFRRR